MINKFILFMLLSTIIGCNNRKEEIRYSTKPYNTPLKVEIKPLFSNVHYLEIKINDSSKISMQTTNNGHDLIQKEYWDKEWFTILIGFQGLVANYSMDELKCYHIKWKGQTKNFNQIPIDKPVYTSLNEDDFRTLYPEHKGAYHYEQYDTINLNLTPLENLIEMKYLSVKQINNYKGDEK